MISPNEIKILATQKSKENFQYLNRIKTRTAKDLDQIITDLHQETFSRINCLDCANCCRTLGPQLTVKDIDRIARYQKMKPDAFIRKYLVIDEDGDYVFQSMPCPFLTPDNYCTVYSIRPKACAGYPHTDQQGFRKRLMLTYHNTFTCPAVYEMVEQMKRILP